jgi:hypothetical protein
MLMINIPLGGFSINSMYHGNRKFGKTSKAKDWSYQVNFYVDKYAEQLIAMKKDFDPQKHGFKVSMLFGYKDFYNKAGSISSKVEDLSNVEKPLLDLIFLPDNHGPLPYKSRNLNIDDKYVVELQSRKVRSDHDFISVTVELVSLDSQYTT